MYFLTGSCQFLVCVNGLKVSTYLISFITKYSFMFVPAGWVSFQGEAGDSGGLENTICCWKCQPRHRWLPGGGIYYPVKQNKGEITHWLRTKSRADAETQRVESFDYWRLCTQELDLAHSSNIQAETRCARSYFIRIGAKCRIPEHNLLFHVYNGHLLPLSLSLLRSFTSRRPVVK